MLLKSLFERRKPLLIDRHPGKRFVSILLLYTQRDSRENFSPFLSHFHISQTTAIDESVPLLANIFFYIFTLCVFIHTHTSIRIDCDVRHVGSCKWHPQTEGEIYFLFFLSFFFFKTKQPIVWAETSSGFVSQSQRSRFFFFYFCASVVLGDVADDVIRFCLLT